MIPKNKINSLINKLELMKEKDKNNLNQIIEHDWRNNELSMGFMRGRISSYDYVICELKKLLDE